MDTSYDKFIRTTDEDHEKQVKKIFKKLYDKGDIYKGHYEGMYCTPCESFFTESQLVDGKCPDCGRPVQPAKEEAYFFKMSKYADRLIEHINTHPEFIQPQNVDPVKEAEQQRQRERLDQQIVSLESERKALEEKIKEDLLRLSQKVVLPATDLQQKKCPNCGGMVAGARFCPKCGYDLNSIKEK